MAKFKDGTHVKAIDLTGGYGEYLNAEDTYVVRYTYYDNLVHLEGLGETGFFESRFVALTEAQLKAQTWAKASYAHSPGYQQGSGGVTKLSAEQLAMIPMDIFNVKPDALQTQVGGTHYTDMVIQPAHYNLANGMGWAEGDAISYISRWRAKGGLQDLRKARQTLLLLIEHEEAKGTK